MILSVRHITSYRFTGAGGNLVQRLHLTPSDHDGLKILTWTVDAPGIDRAARYVDAFGNVTHLVTPPPGLGEVVISAIGLVETEDRAGVTGDTPGSVPLGAYLRETPATVPNAAIRALARQVVRHEGIKQLHELMFAVRQKIDYVIGVTDAHTTAAEAITDGKGVCQDHAHVLISAARVLGVPARYISGYMAAEATELAEASHAWAEAWVPGLGWVGFDAANDVCPDERYVRTAAGMDAHDAAPVRGIRRGSTGNEELTVEVLVGPATEQ